VERKGSAAMNNQKDTTILLVEDNPRDEELTLRALRRSNLGEVLVARDGKEALDYLFARNAHSERNPDHLPTLLVLDMKLPKVSGIEVLRELRSNERTRLLPVVIFTSSGEDEDRLAGYSNGANSYVRKPIDYREFTEAVQKLGLYWLFMSEPPPPMRRRCP
jgi:two-component system response regulator